MMFEIDFLMICSENNNEKNEINAKECFRIKEINIENQIVFLEKPIILYYFTFAFDLIKIFRVSEEVIVGSEVEKIQLEMKFQEFFKKYSKVLFF